MGLAPQVGFGSDYGIDSIGTYWFYSNASNVFVQKCLVCTTDLSHVTGFRAAEKTLISAASRLSFAYPSLLLPGAMSLHRRTASTFDECGLGTGTSAMSKEVVSV